MNAVLVLLIVNTVLLTLALIVLIVGFAVLARRLSEKITQIVVATQEAREVLVSTAAVAKQLVGNANGMVLDVKRRLERLDSLAEQVEQLVAVKSVAEAASRAVMSSKITLVSILEGLRQGAKILLGHRNERKEEPIDE